MRLTSGIEGSQARLINDRLPGVRGELRNNGMARISPREHTQPCGGITDADTCRTRNVGCIAE